MISSITKSFPFKRLPREIGDQIYDYVFETGGVAATTYHVSKWERTAAGDYPASCRCIQIRLALFRVDHEIRRESIMSFYGHRKFSIGSDVYPHCSVEFLKGIGRERLELIRIIKFSLDLYSKSWWDASGRWHQTFWSRSSSHWRATFEHLSLACCLRTLEIDLGHTALTRRGLTPEEWAELEICLVGIKGRMDLIVCNGCEVSVKENPVQCESMTTETASHTNTWTCKKGELEWSPMESVYVAEWSVKKPGGVLRRSYKGPRGACSVLKP